MSTVAEEPTEILEGEIERVTFENRDTGFRVVKIAVEGRTDRVALVGAFPQVNVGARIRARGTWITDKKFGEQFRAASVTELRPSTLEGLEKYLGSGVIKGVGPKNAKRIVAAFGQDSLKVLDETPDRLREVSGLGKSRVDAIIEAWREHSLMRDAMVFLQGFGATPALAMRIYKRYGGNTMNQVSRDPYRLSIDVRGVGFKTADRIAAGLGHAKDSVERAVAAIHQAMRDATDHGHTSIVREDLSARAAALLELEIDPAPILDRAIEAAKIERLLVEEIVPGDASHTRLLTPAHLYLAELGVASAVARLTRDTSPLGAHADDAIAEFQRDVKIELSAEQRTAVKLVADHSVVVLTGGPGVGKTTVVRAILNVFVRAKLAVRLAAPTGRAAKRMTEATGAEAVTLHRLLEFDPKAKGWKRNRDRPLEADALIVDEASMLDVEIAAALFAAIRSGARVVLVGDVDQLPSVGPGAVLRDVIASEHVACARLVHIHRQGALSLIVENAHRIHRGETPLSPPPGDDGPKDFFVIDRREPRTANETILELVKTRIPRRFGFDSVRDVQVLTPMNRGDSGTFALNASLQSVLNPVGASITRGQITFRVGDKVMQLRNDYDREVFNGDVGFIASVDTEEQSLVVKFDGRDVEYDYNETEALMLAYACTIHKSQGSEYPAVVIPLLTSHFIMLSRNLFYTAVTRGRKLVVLVCDPRAVSMALSEDRKDERKTRLRDRIRHAFTERTDTL